MMPANAHTSKEFTRMCFEKSELHQQISSSSVILVENPLSGELVLPDFDQSNLRRGYDDKC